MKKVRYVVQGAFLLLMIVLAVRHQIYKGGAAATPPIDSYCPFGGIETAYLYLTSGTFLTRTGYSNLILLFGLIIMGVLLNSGFCGWICPFGTVQEWLGIAGKQIKKVNISKNIFLKKIDHYGRYVKYVVLILIIVATIVSGRMIFRDWDPFIAFFHMGFGNLAGTAYLVLFIVLIGSLFINRFWCRYFCPLAVIVGGIGKYAFFKIECEEEKCTCCRKCERLCPMDVDIAKQGRIETVECNSCLDCLEAKDVKHALNLRLPNRGMILHAALYPVLLSVLFFGTVFGAKAIGAWQTGSGPEKHDSRSEEIRQENDSHSGTGQGSKKGGQGRGRGSGKRQNRR